MYVLTCLLFWGDTYPPKRLQILNATIALLQPLLNSGRGRSQSSALLGEKKKTYLKTGWTKKVGEIPFKKTGIYVVYRVDMA